MMRQEKTIIDKLKEAIEYKDLFKNDDLVRFWIVNLKREISHEFTISKELQHIIYENLETLEEMKILRINDKRIKELTKLQKEILHLLETLYINDRDIDTLCVCLDPNYEKYGSFYDNGVPFKEEVEKNLIDLLLKGYVMNETKTIDTIIKNGKRKKIDYRLWSKTKVEKSESVSFEIDGKRFSFTLLKDKNGNFEVKKNVD